MLNKSLLAATLLAVSATPVMADQSPDWNSIQVSYAKSEYKNDSFMGYEPEGLILNCTLALSRNIFTSFQMTSAGDDTKSDFVNSEIDSDSKSISIGFYSPVNEKTDWFTSIGYTKDSSEFGGDNSNIKSDGYVLRVGAKSMIYPGIELNWSVVHQDIETDGIETGEAETGYELGSQINFTSKVDLGVGYSSINNIDTISLGFRYRF